MSKLILIKNSYIFKVHVFLCHVSLSCYIIIYVFFFDKLFQKLDASEMLSHISNVRQALRLAVSDFQASDLPGFCLPKKVNNYIILDGLEGDTRTYCPRF